MLNADNVLCAELALCRYFTEEGVDSPVPVKSVMDCMKIYLQGTGIRKSEIKEARKRLGIKSENRGGEYFWLWASEQSPKEAWKEKSRELDGRKSNAGEGD